MYPGLKRLKQSAGAPFIFSLSGEYPTSRELSFFRESTPSGVIFFKRNIDTVELLGSSVNCLKKIDGIHLFSIDEEGGRVRRLPDAPYSLPSAAEMSQMDEKELIERWRNLGSILSAAGINVDMAPVVDICSGDSKSIVGDRSFGTDPSVIVHKAGIVMEALLSAGVQPVIKHFPGHGATTVDSHKSLPVIDKDFDRIRSEDMVPFIRLSGKTNFMMIAHILVPQVSSRPATLSPEWGRIVREEIGFRGITILDDMEMHALDSWSVEEKVDAFIRTGFDLMPVCSGSEETMYLFWEAMVRNLERERTLADSFETVRNRLSNLLVKGALFV